MHNADFEDVRWLGGDLKNVGGKWLSEAGFCDFDRGEGVDM